MGVVFAHKFARLHLGGFVVRSLLVFVELCDILVQLFMCRFFPNFISCSSSFICCFVLV